jgi:hypothetical protein
MALQVIDDDVINVKQMIGKRLTPEGGVTYVGTQYLALIGIEPEPSSP